MNGRKGGVYDLVDLLNFASSAGKFQSFFFDFAVIRFSKRVILVLGIMILFHEF